MGGKSYRKNKCTENLDQMRKKVLQTVVLNDGMMVIIELKYSPNDLSLKN